MQFIPCKVVYACGVLPLDRYKLHNQLRKQKFLLMRGLRGTMSQPKPENLTKYIYSYSSSALTELSRYSYVRISVIKSRSQGL